jgi:hypothetical protein
MMRNANVRDERRIHKVFVTRNTEYHVRRGRCIAVRDRRTGKFLEDHAALKRFVACAVQYRESSVTMTPVPKIGDSLCFDGTNIVTSQVLAIERAPKDLVRKYRL